tara:strand:- start:107 stop:331 length:225 start_codon:yes stop_codon:yes gene_type:complete
MNDEYLKGFDPLENKENVSLEDKVEKYVDWFIYECGDQHDELFWLIDSAINPTKETAEDVSEAINDTYNRMNEK